ncbi:MAG: adenylate kinase [Planctomycetaceae bacterium]|nr:adenylate kinase [Planctomycetaceae bacterium]
MKLILLGPPGAGKGTQCKRIVERYGMAHLSSGDILRAERAAGSELGKKAQGYMDRGDLVPDDLIIDMMIAAIKKAPKGYVLDGFPRTVAQAEGLDAALAKAGERIDAIINLQVPDEAILSRMTGRRSCPVCGAVYHVVNLRPRVDNRCDKDNAELVQRKDDTPAVVANRLKTYHEQTAAVIGYYKRANTIVAIDSNKDVDQVTADVFKRLDALDG